MFNSEESDQVLMGGSASLKVPLILPEFNSLVEDAAFNRHSFYLLLAWLSAREHLQFRAASFGE